MNPRTPSTLLSTPRIASKLALMEDLKGLTRLHFLHAAVNLGLLKVLKTPARLEYIAKQLAAADFRDVEVRIIMPSERFAGLLARA